MNGVWSQIPDGAAAAGFAWADEITLTFTDADNNPADMTGAVGVFTSEQLEAQSLTPQTSTVVSGESNNIVTFGIGLTDAQMTAITGNSFRWYIGESAVLDAALYYRKIVIGRPA